MSETPLSGLAQGRDASVAIRQALDGEEHLIRETGTPNDRVFVHLGRADLTALEGDAEGRLRELRAAREQFERMGAARRVQEIDAALTG